MSLTRPSIPWPFLLLAFFYYSAIHAPNAAAANWFKLRGTEPGKPPHAVKFFGFIQPTYIKEYNDRISGAVGALAGNTVAGTTGPDANGEKQVPGTIPPERKHYSDFIFRRARLGARGTLLPVSDNIDYFFMAEFANNGVNRDKQFGRVLDASMTFNWLSRGKDAEGLDNLGARFRIGQFLFSETSEALSHSTPGRRVHVFMPEMTFQNAIRRVASDNGRFNFPDSVPANAARDVGVEVFDWAEFPAASGGPWELTYAAALGNGTTLDEWNRDRNHRQYYWLSFAKLFDKTRGPRRHDAMLYGFFQQGDIGFNTDIDGDGIDDLSIPGGEYNPAGPVDVITGQPIGPTSRGTRLVKNGFEQDVEQRYWGVGVEYFDKPFDDLGQIRLEAEFSRVDGLIFDGAQFPSVAANQQSGGMQSIRYDTDGTNQGWYVDAGYDIQQHLGLKGRTTINVRYDEFARNKGNKEREANWNIWSLTGEYFFSKYGRATLTYQWRDVNANNSSGVARTNGNAVLEGVNQRLGLQLTLLFNHVPGQK
ncbi:MAG: hypothetical protein ABFS24_11230 [Pseudomonadota bacterium]